MITQARMGNQGPLVGRLGYGAMVLEGYYGASDDEAAKKTLVHAIESGMMIDSADAYGNGHNEMLIAEAIRNCTTDPFIATKFGIVFDENEVGTELPTNWGFSLNINGTADYAGKALNASLKRLDVEAIDLWYAHFPDPSIPIEETVGAMAGGVKEGKVKALGLSNVTAEQVRKAHAVHPIAAVQYEYSLWRREVEKELLPTLRELGIGLVAWSPLGSGFLTGTVESLDDTDFRQNNPRFTKDNLASNRDRFSPLLELAKEYDLSPAQLALSWLLHQGDDIFPIPGTRKIARIDENAQSLSIKLDEAALAKIDEIARPGKAQGETLV